MNDHITAHLEGFEGDFGIIKISDNQKIRWPKSKLPKGLKKGANLAISLMRQENLDKEKSQIAKELLQEILNGQINEKEKIKEN